MDIKDLVPVDYSNQRVLLTSQVAEVFGTSPARIRDNFRYAKKQFKEGVHYFKVTGEALRTLKFQLDAAQANGEQSGISHFANTSPDSPLQANVSESGISHVAPLIPKTANTIILYTEQGCARHCKMLNTKEAWAMFDVLEKHYFNPATHVAPPAETPRAEQPVKKVRKSLPEYAVVYAALLDNALVKIGLTTDFNRRIKEVRKETGLDVEDVFTTGNMPLDDARKLESTVKAKFHEKNKGGELYDAPFELVKAALLDKHVDSFDKLLALAREMQPSPEKNQLLLQAANLLK